MAGAPAFAPLSVGTLNCVSASADKPADRVNLSTGNQARRRHQIRLIEHRRRRRLPMGELRPRDALPARRTGAVDKPNSPSKQRHPPFTARARPIKITYGSGLRQTALRTGPWDGIGIRHPQSADANRCPDILQDSPRRQKQCRRPCTHGFGAPNASLLVAASSWPVLDASSELRSSVTSR